MYSIVIALLTKTMKELEGDFKKEIRSINTQFYVFLFSYLTMSAFVTCMGSPEITQKIGADNLNMVYLILAFYW